MLKALATHHMKLLEQSSESCVDEALSKLHEVQDKEWAIQLLLSTFPATLATSERLLQAAMTIATELKLSDLIPKVEHLEQMLGTFALVGGAQFNGSDWQLFSQQDVQQIMQRYLSQGDLHAVRLMWARHSPGLHESNLGVCFERVSAQPLCCLCLLLECCHLLTHCCLQLALLCLGCLQLCLHQ